MVASATSLAAFCAALATTVDGQHRREEAVAHDLEVEVLLGAAGAADA